MTNKSSFDLDFGYGRKGEKLVEELLTGGKTVEVKRITVTQFLRS